jgi:biopolymer transport protein ExbD
VDTNSKIYVDDNIVTENLIAAKVAPKIWENPDLIVILNIDEGVLYGVVDVILDQLKEAKAFRITFATERRR